MCKILISVTALGEGLPELKRAHRFDAGFDVYAAADITFQPYSRAEVPLGFTYRLTEPSVVRDGQTYARTLEVVKKGSGLWWFDPQAIIFDAGFQPPLDAPEGIKLIVINRSPNCETIARGKKAAQLVMREVLLAQIVPASLDDLRSIPPPDTRLDGRLGSTG
jgi:dUTPase